MIQLYETTLVRHGIMLVGPPGAGKSNIINVLQDVLSRVLGIAHKRTRMNPKAIRAEEMFGETDRYARGVPSMRLVSIRRVFEAVRTASGPLRRVRATAVASMASSRDSATATRVYVVIRTPSTRRHIRPL